MDPLISIIVPIYNVEAHLPKCLDSIVNQSYRNLEIILVDDGSPDGCGVICDGFAQTDTRIRVIHKENGGLSSARNAGLDIMRGSYVMFVDSDDWLSLDAVKVLYRQIVEDGSDIAVGQMEKVWPDGRTEACITKKELLSSGKMLQFLTGRGRIPCYACGKLYRSTLFDNLRFPRISRAEDVWVLPHIIEKSTSISMIPVVIYHYYQRSTSVVHTSKDPEHLDSMKASLHVARILYNENLITNAASYYYAAVNEGKLVQNKGMVRQLLKESFTKYERLHISTRCVIHWRFFIPNRMYQGLRRLKKAILSIWA